MRKMEIKLVLDVSSEIKKLISKGIKLMDQNVQALTDAVLDVSTKFDVLNSTLQTEIGEITALLTSAVDHEALETAAEEAITKLAVLSSKMSDMNITVQNIVP